jgi:hypothetical protein
MGTKKSRNNDYAKPFVKRLLAVKMRKICRIKMIESVECFVFALLSRKLVNARR